MKRLIPAAVLVALACPSLSATEDLRETIDKGIALHDQGRYPEAIATFREALRQDPDNELALYELAYSLSASNAFDECVKTAERGLKTAETFRAQLYAVQGNCLDMAGSPQKAVKAYQRGLSEFPTEPDLAFNCALTQLKLRRFEEARQLAKISIRQRPNHASSHFILAVAYDAGGYNVPGIFAALRFLSLEPTSERAAGIAAMTRDAFNLGVTRPSDEEVLVTVGSGGPKDEGDFSTEALKLSILSAVRFAEVGEGKTDIEMLAQQMSGFLESLNEETAIKEQASFARTTYVPFLRALHREGLAVPFTYFAFSSLAREETEQWRNAHAADTEKLSRVLEQLNGTEVR